MRRVITGHTPDGKSIIVEDAEISGSGEFGNEMIPVWNTGESPSIPLKIEDFNKDDSFNFMQLKAGETVMVVAVMNPTEEYIRRATESGVDVVARWRERLQEEFGFHRTDTIDYDIILSGEVWMQVDDGVEVHLKAGDCVIQNGTRHAWHNRSNSPCVFASVLVGARRV